jgi:putative membrane protein
VTLRDLPAWNAALNATSALLLAAGYAAIRAGRRETHRRFMLAACTSSTLFLVSYLVYHFQVGSVPFTGQGPIRTVYFAILITHTVLAVAIVPLVLVTLTRALRERFDAHRKIARLTLPFWAYVSVTGVVIYWMLYRL